MGTRRIPGGKNDYWLEIKWKKKDKLKYYKFLNSLPKKINNLYFRKLKGKFKLNNKSKKKNGFDPVTNIDKAIEFFLRKEIKKKIS